MEAIKGLIILNTKLYLFSFIQVQAKAKVCISCKNVLF